MNTTTATTLKSPITLTLVKVMSVDGKTTYHDEADIYQWTSLEDKAHFFTLISQASLIIMGRQTYEAARSVIKLRPETLRVVITHRPEDFAGEAVPGQLEFMNISPHELVQHLQKRGFTEGLMVGGSQTTAAFMRSGLISRLMITIEPRIFGAGRPLMAPQELNAQLKLDHVTQLNDQGTLLVEYQVV